jgi:hypothetical protein
LERAAKFIRDHFQAVQASEGWKILETNRSALEAALKAIRRDEAKQSDLIKKLQLK